MQHTLFKTLLKLVLILPLFLLSACLTKDAPGDAPKNFVVTPGDGRVTITWNDDPGLTYWVFAARASKITPDDYASFPESRLLWPVRSGLVLTGLTNGETYAFTINATRNGSPASPAAPSVAVVPRLAGDSWVAGGTAGSNHLNEALNLSGLIVAVGDGGALYSTLLGDTWTARVSGSTVNLRSALYDGARLLVVGDNGTARISTDFLATAPTWKSTNTGTAVRLNSVMLSGSTYVAVGANGTILTGVSATDTTTTPNTATITWTARTSGTTANLNKVAYQNGKFIALGDAGTILTSPDAITWTAQVSGSTANLRDIAGVLVNDVASYVVVGSAGTILRSADLSTWVAEASGSTADLNAIALGSRLMIAGAGGTLLYGTGNSSWTVKSTGLAGDVYDLVRADGGYIAIGANGSNSRAF